MIHETGPDFEAVTRLQAELEGESPRGTVLVATSMLEEMLRELISAYLVPNPSSSDTLLDGPNAPFGSFSGKIDAAYRLGLISNQFCRDLHLIRKIRNDVAHQPKSFRFEDSSPSSRIEALTKSHGIFARSPKWVEEHGTPSLREQFTETTSWMLFFLAAEKARVKATKPSDLEFGYFSTLDTTSGLPENFS